MLLRYFACFVTILTLTNSGHAILVTFDFAIPSGSNVNGLALDGHTTGSTSAVASGVSPVTMSATAMTAAGGTPLPLFNYTAGNPNFGINSEGSDGPDEIDGDGIQGDESMEFSFTPSGFYTMQFVSIDFDRFTLPGQDEATIAFDGGSAFTLTTFDSGPPATGNVSGAGVWNNFDTPIDIMSGQTITLSYVAGNGFGLESIVLDLVPIPEASSVLSLGLFACTGLLWRFGKQYLPVFIS